MTRADRGIEQLDFNTFNVRLGGLGGNPKDLGIDVDKGLFAPRLGVAYRINDDTVFRTGYGRTFNPLPWSRPMRGFYPLTIAYSDAGPNGFTPYGTLANGIPRRAESRHRERHVPLPRGVDMRSPDPERRRSAATSTRGTSFVERRLPGDLSVSVGYVGTAHQRRLRRHQPELRRQRRQRQPPVLRAGRQRRHPRLGRAHPARATTRCRWR